MSPVLSICSTCAFSTTSGMQLACLCFAISWADGCAASACMSSAQDDMLFTPKGICGLCLVQYRDPSTAWSTCHFSSSNHCRGAPVQVFRPTLCPAPWSASLRRVGRRRLRCHPPRPQRGGRRPIPASASASQTCLALGDDAHARASRYATTNFHALIMALSFQLPALLLQLSTLQK